MGQALLSLQSTPQKEESQQKTQKSDADKGKQKEQESAHKQQESKALQPSHNQPAGQGHPSQGDNFKDTPNSQIRKIIAKRLLESKNTVPHYYVKATADLGAATGLRKTMKAQGTKVKYLLFARKAFCSRKGIHKELLVCGLILPAVIFETTAAIAEGRHLGK